MNAEAMTCFAGLRNYRNLSVAHTWALSLAKSTACQTTLLEYTGEESIAAQAVWLCRSRNLQRLAKRNELSPTSVGCVGCLAHACLAATGRGLVGFVADELWPGIGGRAV